MSRKTKKLIWSAPLVAVFAVVGALALFMTLSTDPAAAQAEEAPGAPTNLKVTALSPTSIELSWDPPTDGGSPDGYRLDYSDDGQVWEPLEATYDSEVYTDDDGLMAKQTRYYRVFAYNSAGHGHVLGPMSAETKQSTVPAAVEDLDATSTDDDPATEFFDQIDLTWSPVDNPEGAPVTDYLIRVSKNNRSFSDLKTIKASTCEGSECKYTNKDPKQILESTTRWYKVYAINSVGRGPGSGDAKGSTAEGTAPTAVTALRGGWAPPGRMVLYWDPPRDGDGNVDHPAGAPILGYYVWGGPVLTTAGGTADAIETDDSGFLDTAEADHDTAATAHDEPPKRNQVYWVDAGTSITLSTSVLGRLDNYTGTPDLAGFDDPDTDAVETDNATHWGFRVMAVNRVVQRDVEDGNIGTPAEPDANPVVNLDLTADGNWSNLIRLNPKAEDITLRRPTLSATADTNANGGRTQTDLEWKATGSVSDTDYRLEYSTDKIDWKEVANVETGAGTQTFTHTDRTAGMRYTYRVLALHTADTVPGAPAVDIYTQASTDKTVATAQPARPNEPANLVAEGQSETEIEVTWEFTGADSGEELGYGKLVGFRVEESDDGEDASWTILKANTGLKDICEGPDESNDYSCTYVRDGLKQGQTKYFRVSTINNATRTSQKYSIPSNSDLATTGDALIPNAPSGLIAKAAGRTAIELLWNARAPDVEAAPVDGYRIEASPLNSDGMCVENWSVVEEKTPSEATSYTHSGLMPATGYCYQVFSVNVVGTSTDFAGHGDSYVIVSDNDSIAMTDPAVAPGMPMSVTAMPTSDTEITVTWEGPADNGGADITGYMVQRAYMGADNMMSEWMAVDPAHMGMDMMYMDMGLMQMTKYYYRVAAMNSVGMGEYSDGMDMATTEASDTAPGVPTAVTAMETSDTEITVTWGSPASDGGADITGYMVQRAYMGADNMMSEWMAVDPAHMGMDMMYMDTGLMPETMYYYQVRAMNAVGNGEWSDGMASAMTDPTPVMTELGMASNLRIGVNSGGTIQVTWDAADNAVGYIVIAIDRSDFSPKSAPVNPDSAGVTYTTLNLGGLTVGNNYYVYVAATGSAGDNTLSIPPLEVTAE